MRLGIDFGTTRTVVAGCVKGRYPVAQFETSRGYVDYLPGIAFAHGGQLDYGWESPSVDGAGQTLRSIKRVVGQLRPDDLVPGLDEQRVALELVTDYLRYVRRMLVEHSNLLLDAEEPLEAMVAVPANSNTGQRYLTVEAFHRAGFRVVGMLNEPTAAAIEFAHENLGGVGRRSPKRYVVVYDLGGGTFDTSAVSLVDRRFELLRTEGLGALGGDDFDEIILQVGIEQALREGQAIDPSQFDSSRRSRLLELCREAKEGLSPTSRKLLVDLAQVLPGTAAVVLDTSEIYDRCQPLIDRTIELLDRVFSSLSTFNIDPNNPRELGAIYLVGGATAFPPVGRALRRLHKRKIQMAPQPHAATAVGLAIAADPDSGVFVRESVTRNFGVWREGEAGRAKVFDPILLKDTRSPEDAPIVVQRSYWPVHSVGHLRFIECTELDANGQPAGDLTPWADLYFPYDPSLRDFEDLSCIPVRRTDHPVGGEIVETYTYSADGSLTITVQNRSHGYQRRFVVPWRTESRE
ncbi:MAG: Hsp70 family protein [Myxococcales bacterium]